ncbi:hypothetical protein [Sphingosinicella sp.]|uniref:hypothetical protein n=1 Tax=Sphingosinicella sp. TaxID=1917971 RepID=UPI0040376146
MTRWMALVLAALAATPAAAQRAPHPLFADQQIIQLTIRGPLRDLMRVAERSEEARDATLTLSGARTETHAIRLSPRGISRRRRDVCTFPPLRIEFRERPAATSFFTGQRRLKLVTHCRAQESFSNFTLLEYAAYRLLNALTPVSLRVRLARIDYVDEGSRQPIASRLGFLIEDTDAAARRNGLTEVELRGTIPVARLDPRAAARTAVFNYMVGNLDWAMNAGPAGDTCCHNTKLFGAQAAGAALVPVPYDFDYSGLVNAPYAVPPAQVPVRNMRIRRYRGFCSHNSHALAVAAEFFAARRAVLAALNEVAELSAGSRQSAATWLNGFFEDVATPAEVERNLLRTCL